MVKTLKDILSWPQTGRILTKRETEYLAIHKVMDAPVFFKTEGGDPIVKNDKVGKSEKETEATYKEANATTESKEYQPDSADNKGKNDRAKRFLQKKMAKEKKKNDKDDIDEDKEYQLDTAHSKEKNDRTKRFLQKKLLKNKKEQTDEEIVNELSSKTLKSYLGAARSDKKSSDAFANHAAEKADTHKSNMSKEIAKNAFKAASKTSKKRANGMNMAVDKLAARNEDEQLNELSSKTLNSYLDKNRDTRWSPENGKALNWDKRSKGALKAVKKINDNKKNGIENNEKRMSRNEDEQLNELSSKTLKSYIKKSSDDLNNHAFDAGHDSALKDRNSLKADIKAQKRLKGIHKAVDKLKEDEQLDELSSKTLKSYRLKASRSFADSHADKHLNDNKKNGIENNEKTMSKRANGMYKATVKVRPDLKVENINISEANLSDHISNAIKSSGSSGTNHERVSDAVKKVRENARSFISHDHPAMKHINAATKHLGSISPEAKGHENFSEVRNSLEKAHSSLSDKPKIRVKAGSSKNEDISLVDKITNKFLEEKKKCNKSKKGTYCALHGNIDCASAEADYKSKIVDEKLNLSKGRSIAAILAKHHDRKAIKKVYADDEAGSKEFHRHVRAAERYNRVAMGKRPFSEDEYINEKLEKGASVGDYINDFVNSTNGRFKGKSKEGRRKMAIAAWYAAQKKNEEIEIPVCETEIIMEAWNNLSHPAKEIVLHTDNSDHLRTGHDATVHHLQRKIYDKMYDHKKAESLWAYHADRAAKDYSQMHGRNNWNKEVPHSARKEAAKFFASRAKEERLHTPLEAKVAPDYKPPPLFKEDINEDDDHHPLNDYKAKHVQGLYNYNHYEHPNGNWVQIRHGGSKGRIDAVHSNAKTGEHKKFDNAEDLKKHVAKLHEDNEEEKVQEKWIVTHKTKVLHSGDHQATALKVYRANPGSKLTSDGPFRGQQAHIALGPLIRDKYFNKKNNQEKTTGPWGQK